MCAPLPSIKLANMVLVRMWGNAHAFSADGNVSGPISGKSYLTIRVRSLKHVQRGTEKSRGVTGLSRDRNRTSGGGEMQTPGWIHGVRRASLGSPRNSRKEI